MSKENKEIPTVESEFEILSDEQYAKLSKSEQCVYKLNKLYGSVENFKNIVKKFEAFNKSQIVRTDPKNDKIFFKNVGTPKQVESKGWNFMVYYVLENGQKCSIGITALANICGITTKDVVDDGEELSI